MISAQDKPKAFSLVEVALALGVATFALVLIFGLLPIGINSNQASIQQTIATNLATAIIADMRQVPSAAAVTANAALSAKSPVYSITVPAPGSTNPTTIIQFFDDGGANLGDGGTSHVAPSAARYRATIVLTTPATGQATATYGSVTIGWPAAAANSLGSITAFVALDRNGP